MKDIIWIGPDRLIPPHGAAEPGRELTLPDNVAESFIDQGLAEPKGKTKIDRTLASKLQVED